MRKLNSDVIKQQALAVVAQAIPEHHARFAQTLDRVPAAHWALEWNLPWWLGSTFGMKENIFLNLCASNVLGLVALRLYDDLSDRQLARTARVPARTLAQRLEEIAMQFYRPYFDASDSFWTYAANWMNAWHAATRTVPLCTRENVETLYALHQPPAQHIAKLGAPLKLNALAVSRLTMRPEIFSPLQEILDHVLIAAVLHDHVVDWATDLQANRQNFFIGYLSPCAQTKENQSANCAHVAQGWIEDAPRAYFQIITYHLDRARDKCNALNIIPLCAHLTRFKSQTAALYRARRSMYRKQVQRAAREIFKIHFALP